MLHTRVVPSGSARFLAKMSASRVQSSGHAICFASWRCMPSLELTSTLPVIFSLPTSSSTPGHGWVFESRTDAEWEARPAEASVLQQVNEFQADLPITSDDGDNSGRSTRIRCCPVPPDISMSLAVIEPSHFDYTFAMPVFSD